ncbi:hypothetical protein [Streptomyces sp. NPDC058657]|uniref:hypothetical protein n=1 Tax=unclassified Streptomyces TaxID=2593676 RepID=UPI0036578115
MCAGDCGSAAQSPVLADEVEEGHRAQVDPYLLRSARQALLERGLQLRGEFVDAYRERLVQLYAEYGPRSATAK